MKFLFLAFFCCIFYIGECGETEKLSGKDAMRKSDKFFRKYLIFLNMQEFQIMFLKLCKIFLNYRNNFSKKISFSLKIKLVEN